MCRSTIRPCLATFCDFSRCGLFASRACSQYAVLFCWMSQSVIHECGVRALETKSAYMQISLTLPEFNGSAQKISLRNEWSDLGPCKSITCQAASDLQRRDTVLEEQRAQELGRAVQVVEARYCNASTPCSGEVDNATVRAVRGLPFGADVITDVPGSQLTAGAAAVASLLAAVLGCQRFDSPAPARSIERVSGAHRKARQRSRAKHELAT